MPRSLSEHRERGRNMVDRTWGVDLAGADVEAEISLIKDAFSGRGESGGRWDFSASPL